MKIYVPNYYYKFNCIADKCLHTCCKGWEIDVDAISLDRYSGNSAIASKIKDGQFILTEDERCPFLRSDGLCQMIIDYGEDYICDICKDHPRFREFYEDRIEMGLGLCCEEVVRVLLNETDRFHLVNIEDSSDKLELDNTYAIVQNRNESIVSRMEKLYVSVYSSSELANIYLSLERLEEKWDEMLQNLLETPVSINDRHEYIEKHSIEFEQFICYFLFRHQTDVSFAIESINLIADLCCIGYELSEVIRMYSSEVEYSDINVDTLMFDYL